MFFPSNFFHPSLMFVEKAGATQVEHLKVLAFWGRLLALSANIIPGWKSLPGDKCSNLFHQTVSDEEKRLKLTHGANVIKLFLSVINEFYIISESVCPWQAFPA